MLELAISLLEDENGISYNSYKLLFEYLFDHEQKMVQKYVKIQDNRVYLPENWDK